MTTAIKRRRGTTAEHSTFVGLEGEITIDSTKDTVVVHDGSTAGGFPLAKENMTGNLTFADNAKAIFGAGSDLQIYHDGSDSYVSDQGAGNLKVQGSSFVLIQDASGTNMLRAKTGEFVDLYYNGSAKLATTSTGINVTGLTDTDTLSVSGNTTLGDASTDTVTVNGYMGVGGSAISSAAVYVRNTALSGTTQVGVNSNFTGSSGATSSIRAFSAGVKTEAASFTASDAVSFYANNVTKGAGSTITNQHGVYIADQTQGTNNYGITSVVSSGTNKWNIYASGTAANYFAGNVGIGTSSPSALLHLTSASTTQLLLDNSDTVLSQGQLTGAVEFYQRDSSDSGTGTTGKIAMRSATRPDTGTYFGNAADMAFYVSGAADGSASNNASLEALTLRAGGNVGINTNSPASPLHVVGEANFGLNANRVRINSSAATGVVEFNSTVGVLRNIGGYLQFQINGTTESMRITTEGSVGIGTSSPQAKLHVYNDASDLQMRIGNTVAGTNPILRIQGKNAANTTSRYVDLKLNAETGLFTITAPDNNTPDIDALNIDTSGNLGLGVTPSAWNVSWKAMQINGFGLMASNTGLSQHILSNAAFESSGYKYINTGFATDFYTDSGKFIWRTAPSGTAGNAITFDQAMTLDASGRLGIGTSSPNWKLHVVNGADNDLISLVQGSGAGYIALGVNGANAILTAGSASAAESRNLVFQTANSSGVEAERARIDSSGNLLVGKTTTALGTAGVSIASGGSQFVVDSNTVAAFNREGTDGTVIGIFNDAVAVGTISVSGSTTAYNTSSDYRLKEDWVAVADASIRVNALKPVNFAWKVDGKRVDGFLAHEVAEVVPEAVTGEKDAVDDEGNPVYQGIDQSKLVPLLTAALQEALAKIESLTARVSALEGN